MPDLMRTTSASARKAGRGIYTSSGGNSWPPGNDYWPQNTQPKGSKGMLAAIDWTNVLIAVIAGLPSIIAAIFAGLVHGQVKTPSGKSIGEVAEYAHDTAIANNMLLRKHNGPTVELDKATAKAESSTPPSIPAEAQVTPPA